MSSRFPRNLLPTCGATAQFQQVAQETLEEAKVNTMEEYLEDHPDFDDGTAPTAAVSFSTDNGSKRRPSAMTDNPPSAVSPLSDDVPSKSSRDMARLVDLVKQQMHMVKNLTDAQIKSSEELKRLQEEKLQLESANNNPYPCDWGNSGQYPPAPPIATTVAEDVESHAILDSLNGVAGSTPTAVAFAAEDEMMHQYPPPPPAVPSIEFCEEYGPRPVSPLQREAGDNQRGVNSYGLRSFDQLSTHVFPSSHSIPVSPAQSPAVSAVKMINQGGSPGMSMYNRKSRDTWKDEESAMDVTTIPPPMPPPPPRTRQETIASGCWRSLARIFTFPIPDMCVMRKGQAAKQAWREKVAIFLIMVLCSVVFVGVGGFVPLLLCKETEIFTMKEIRNQKNAAWTVIHGTIYDVKNYINKHPGGTDGILDFLGSDASKLFPRKPAAALSSDCLHMEKNPPNASVCEDLTSVDKLVQLPCHSYDGVKKFFDEYKRGTLAYSANDLRNDRKTDWITIRGRIYNVTNYLDAIKDDRTFRVDDEHDNAFLEPTLNSLIINKVNEDATELYDELFATDEALSCLDELFYVGILDERYNPVCHGLNIFMFAALIFVALILLTQCLCSLLYIARAHRTFTKQSGEMPVMVMVPCYNEGDKELRKTIDSVLDTDYPDQNKVMLVVADGVITGKGEDMSTPETLANILGFRMRKRDKSYGYTSIGALCENRATVHYGEYEKGNKFLKYIVVIKTGAPAERASSSRPGNRGKRDSQLIVTGLFNRVHHGREMNELDLAISHALDELQLPVDELRYLMAIDADTRVDTASLSHMVYSMNKNEKVLACCGETRVDNKAQSLVTFIQVFEYYTNHHMKKAFESVFGCVTCLPGCFTLYRIFSEDGRPLLSCDNVFLEYSRNDIESLHEKNLFHLGEDRMLTTLLLQYFPDMHLSFVPEAVCWTIVPHTFNILLSQRRRWINSTFHNMLELLKVDTMCGICCFSMKAIVVLDLISVMVLPASMLYVIFFLYMTFVMGEPISMMLLVLYGIIIGAQVVVFIFRSRWDYLFWFIIFTIFGVPLFYFVLPLYSFWHMDDFSWGQTRMVAKNKNDDKPKEPFKDANIAQKNSDQKKVYQSKGKSKADGTASKKVQIAESHKEPRKVKKANISPKVEVKKSRSIEGKERNYTARGSRNISAETHVARGRITERQDQLGHIQNDRRKTGQRTTPKNSDTKPELAEF